MSKNLNVSLAFTANTNEAIAQIKRLQKELNSLATGQSLKNSGITQITPEIQKAMSAAGELQAKLESAVNLKTGKLDLTAFSQSLKKGETSLAQYAQQLNALGPAGRQAFTSLAQSIIQAEAPLVRCSNKIRELGTTLANTARWQLSSSILHGFMGSIQSAYGYAEDLNESLNNIRIVTGQNIDQMAKFAVEANKAAKALSTTTTEYTNASLIYYQQGLSDQQVKERTDITIKMANVARQSAEVVSDQMTAVWNNFYDGSKSLEHYADVMTALGAATASSTDEIAGGLEKFSAVAQTIGLSYEYAASALATITSISRESEDVVGTALKTIFARIQGLKLGETLDDGTSLNKYSEALSKVGISIFDQAGELKNMDTILNEMGAKWETLNAAQKQALAQTVAGVRQYNQLMTLMNNWDSFQANLGVANSSSGALQNQANIYAESWEAARDRVTASAEAIYDKLLDDKFFIDLLNGTSKAIDAISQLIDNLGGLQGVLFTVGNIITKLFQQQLAQGLRNVAHNIRQTTLQLVNPDKIKKEQQQKKDEAIKALGEMKSQEGGATGKAENAAYAHEREMQAKLIQVADELSDEELKQVQIQMDLVRAMDQRAIAAAKLVDAAEDELDALIRQQKMREKMNNEAEINEKGRTDAGKRLAGWATSNDPENSFDAETQAKMSEAYAEAENKVRMKHNLAGDASLKGYDSEIYKELTGVVQSMDFGEEVNKQIQTIISTAISDARTKLTPQLEANDAVREENRNKIANAGKLRAQGTALGNIGTAFKGTLDDKTGEDVDSAAKQIKQRIEATEKALEQMGDGEAVQPLLDKLDAIKKKLKDTGNSAEDVNKVIDELISTEGSEGIAIEVEDLSSKMANDAELNAKNMLPDFDATGVYEGAADVEGKKILADVKAEDVKPQQQKLDEKLKPDKTQDWADGISAASDAIMGIGSAITSVQGLIDVFNNPDASNWDKLSAVFTTLLTIIPALSSVTSGLGTVFSLLGISASSAGVKIGIAGTTATIPWLPFIAIILGVVAVIGVAIAAGAAMARAYNADAIAAENAAAASRELAEAYNEAKSEYENLMATMDKYSSARDNLDNLTEGTKEYQAALNEANQAALDLIASGDLVKGKDYTIEGGEIVINDDALERMEEESYNKMLDAQASSTMANAVAAQAQAKANQTAAVRANNSDKLWAGALTGLAYGGVGGALVGLAGGAIANGIENEQENAAIDALVAEYQSIGDAAFEGADLFKGASQEYIDSIKDVVKETAAAAEGMSVAAELAANSILAQNEAYNDIQNDDMKDNISGAAGKGYQDAYDKAYQEELNKSKQEWWQFGIGSESNKEAMADYAKSMGLDQLNGYKVTNYKADGSVEYEYIDENGDKQTKTVTKEQIAAQNAATRASEQLKSQTETLIKTFGRLEASSSKADKALADFAGGDLSKASNSEFKDMEKYFEDKGAITENAETGAREVSLDAAKEYVSQFSQEELTAMGYANADEAAAAFQKQFNANMKAWDSIDLPDNLIGTDNISLKTAQAIENNIKEANLGPAGAEAGEKYVEGLNKMVQGLNTDKQAEALDALASVDWSDWDAMEQAEEIMAGLGKEIDSTDPYWQKFIEDMRIANGAVPDFSGLKDDLIAVSSILGKLDFGATISDEDYNKLVEYKDEWKDLFILQADGTRKFIGNSEDMLQSTRESINEQRKELEERKKAQEGFKNANWGYKDSTSGQWHSYTADDWRNLTGVGGVENLMNASGATEDMLEILGYDDTTLGKIIERAKGEGEDAEAAKKELEELYDRIGNFQEENMAETDAQLNEMYASTATSITELNQLFAEGAIGDSKFGTGDEVTAYEKQLNYLTTAAITSAESLDALYAAYDEGMANGATISYETMANALMGLAGQYGNCTEELNAFETALASGNESAMKKAQEQLEASIMLGEAAAEYGLSAEEMEMQAAQMAKTYGLSQRAAAKLAIENQRMNQGVVELSENWSVWKDELNKTDKTTTDYAKAAASLTKTIAKLVGASEDLELPPDFLESPKTMKLIEKAAEGDIDAINELGVAVAGQTIEMMNLDAMVTRTLQDGTTNTTTLTEFKTAKETVLQGIQDLQTAVANGSIAVGDSVGSMGADWASSLNEMAMATGMSVDEMNSLLSSMGVDAKVETKYVEQETQVPVYRTEEKVIQTYPTRITETKTVQTGVDKMTGVVPVAQISMGDDNKSPQVTYTGNGNVSSSSTNSGGSASKTEKTKKSDVVERYKEINDKLNDQSKVMNDASKAADRLWGSERVKAIEQVNKALEKNIDLLKDKRAEAQYNLKEDKNALAEAIKTNAGITLTDKDFDENGNFTSYNEILNGLYAEKSAAEKAAGPTTDEHEKEKIDAIQKRIDAVKAAISNYDETNQLIEDLDTEIQDAIYEWQDNNYEVLNAKLEYEIEINDSELEVIDYYLDKIEDDVYAYVEAMGKYQQQSDIYTDSLAHQKTYYDKLTTAYEAGKISLQAYKEGLQSSQGAIISNLQSLEESKQAMQDYYGNVVSMATEEIGLYTAEMEQLNSVLDHYTSVMELVGKQDDYVTKNKILTSKASNIKNELAVQSELYKASAEDAEMWSKKMAEAQVGSNEYETYKKNWQAAQQATNDAQDAMLAKTQEWAEAMKAIIENDLAEAAASMEKSLTGGISFDELMTSMERRSSLQEEYLTTTNKIYETNKLMRQAQQEIDKTSNSVAKKRLQGFITETNQLQNQNELSQYELEIQQAKYDLLLAEIALEEAQNAKSTVRLQRDSEGNFGYVYTADASAINDAEQNLADKQNSLYNIGLQGANDYQQKYAEILQQSQEAITELTQMWMNGEITDRDEFERRKNEITEYYGKKLEQYSKLHSVALSTDTRVVADAWSSDFTDMMTTTEGWHSAVDGYFESAATSMNEWAGVCATTLETSKLNDLDGALKGIDDKSKALITTLMGKDGKGGVVGAMLAQVDKASLVSQSQIDMQNDIQGTITKYENLLTAVNNAYKAMTAPIKPAIGPFGGNYTPDGTTPPGNGNGGGNGSGGSGYGNGNYSQEVVQILQQWLNEKSTTDKDIAVDGKWGSQSAAMAKAFNYNSIDEVYKAYQEHVTKVTTITDYAYEDDDGKYQGSYKTAKEAAEAAPGGEYAIYESTRRKGTAFHMGPPFFIGYAKNLTDKWKEKEKKYHGGGGGHSSFDPIVRVAFGETGPIPLATGGYTGSWGSYGKLAMLHEKELVLNQGDTANFLTSMEVLERILQVLDLQAFSSQVGGLLSSPGFKESGSQNIQQHIEINAEFPNATDRFEIEEAFKSMANLASQYANQK